MKEMLGDIFLKLLKTRIRDYLFVIISGVFIISIIFFTAGVESCMIFIATGEKAGMTSLIAESEKAFLLSYMLLVVLMILILLSYIRKRIYDYSMLEILGIQKKHKYMFIGFEYLGIVMCSVIGGLLIGGLEVEIIKRVIAHLGGGNMSYGWAPFLFTLIVSFLIFGVGFMVCDQIISCLGIDYVIMMGKNSGKKIRYSLNRLMAGGIIFLFALFSVGTYWGKIGSVVPFVLAAGGMFLLMISATGNYFYGLRKREGIYFKKILWLDSWYNQFFYHMNITYILSVFVFVILFGFGLTLMDSVPIVQSELFPYDVVWYANEEDTIFLNELEENYGVKIHTKPCVRVVSGDYGEHMGISKSIYERWTGEKLDIEDKEIFVVYQRDREMMGTIGIDYGKKKPRLYMGSAEWDIWNTSGPKVLPGNQFTREYKIAGEEQKILTGDFASRAIGDLKGEVFEEVIVFSDEEFKNISKSVGGIGLMVMMDIPEYYNQVVKEVYDYAKIHSQVNFFDWNNRNFIYEKQTCIIESRQEKMFKVIAMIIDIIAMLVTVVFVLVEKTQSDYPEMEWKYHFYKNYGMPLGKRKKYVLREALISEKIAVSCGSVLGMMAVIVRIFLKKLPLKWNVIYFSGALFLAIMMALIVNGVMKIVAWRIFRKIERAKNE